MKIHNGGREGQQPGHCITEDMEKHGWFRLAEAMLGSIKELCKRGSRWETSKANFSAPLGTR